MAKRIILEKELSEDLVSEILVRLPVVTLLRCSCICKSWFDLIKSPNFVKMHLKRSKKTELLIHHIPLNRPRCLAVHAYESLDFITEIKIEIPCLDNNRNLLISGPCNGLLCLQDHEDKLVLYNPAIRKYKSVPPPPPSRTGWTYVVNGFGFGFVSNPDHYLVVSFVEEFLEIEDNSERDESESDDDSDSISSDDEDNIVEEDTDSEIDEDNVDNEAGEDNKVNGVIRSLDIYNPSTNSRRKFEFNYPDFFLDKVGMQYNESLHWTAYRKGVNIIYSLNMRSELDHDIALPNAFMVISKTIMSLTVVQGCLSLFAHSRKGWIDLWVMNEYGVADSWSKHVRIRPVSGIHRPLIFWKDEAILLANTNGQLLSCAPDTLEVEEFKVNDASELLRVMVFQESLVSFI